MKRGRVLRMAVVALLSCAATERDPRDVNYDVNVNTEDLRALEGALGLRERDSGYLYGADLDDDREVTLHDYQLWTTPPPAAEIRFVPSEVRVQVGEPFSLLSRQSYLRRLICWGLTSSYVRSREISVARFERYRWSSRSRVYEAGPPD